MGDERTRVKQPGWPVDLALDWVNDGCLVFDQALDCVYANEPGGALFGLQPAGLVGRNLQSDFSTRLSVEFQRVALPVFARRTAARAILRDASTGQWLEATMYPSVEGLLAIIAELTAQKRSEIEYIARAEFLQQLVDQIPAFLWVIDRNLIVRRIEGGRPMLEALDRDRLIGVHQRVVTEMGCNAEDTELSLDMHRRALRGHPGQYRATWKGVTLEARIRPLRDRDGAIVGILGVGIDVTEQARMQEQLGRSEDRFRAVVEGSIDLVAILDRDSRVTYASPSQRRLLGYPAADAHHIDTWSLVHPDDLDYAREQYSMLERRRTVRLSRPIRLRTKRGQWRQVMVTLTHLRRGDSVRDVAVTVRDVTKELRLEAQLRQSQKLEALGQLAGGVAHDFNNVLAAMSGYAHLLREDLAADDARRRDLDEILKAAERATGITRQLLAFSRQQAPVPRRLDLVEVVHELTGLLRALLPATIALRVSPEPGGSPIAVLADRSQLEVMVTNLTVNARDAMPAGGTLSIGVSTAATPEASSAVLEVRDTGVGMTREVQAHVFEPFFTTKEIGSGTGLGLATVASIVRKHSGSVEITSAVGEGTTVTVRLPMAAAGVEALVHEAAPEELEHAGRVLIIEDEASVREVAARLLQRAGYEVLTAADAATALNLLTTAGALDVVVTDSAMPGMRGEDFAVEITHRRPGLPVILMSGYRDPGWGPMPAAVAAFVQKPFTMPTLLAEIRRVIHRHRTTSE